MIRASNKTQEGEDVAALDLLVLDVGATSVPSIWPKGLFP